MKRRRPRQRRRRQYDVFAQWPPGEGGAAATSHRLFAAQKRLERASHPGVAPERAVESFEGGRAVFAEPFWARRDGNGTSSLRGFQRR